MLLGSEHGLFFGYDPEGNRVGVTVNNLNKGLVKNHFAYEVQIVVKKERTLLRLNLMRFLAKYFIPAKLKEEIINEID